MKTQPQTFNSFKALAQAIQHDDCAKAAKLKRSAPLRAGKRKPGTGPAVAR